MDQINDKIMKLILIGWLRVGVIERFFKESSLNRLWMYTCFPFVSKNWSPVQVESGPRWAKIIFVDALISEPKNISPPSRKTSKRRMQLNYEIDAVA